jgi:hypothetical protein
LLCQTFHNIPDPPNKCWVLPDTDLNSEYITLHMVAMPVSVHCTFETIFQTQTLQKYMYVRTQSPTVTDHAGKQLYTYYVFFVN